MATESESVRIRRMAGETLAYFAGKYVRVEREIVSKRPAVEFYNLVLENTEHGTSPLRMRFLTQGEAEEFSIRVRDLIMDGGRRIVGSVTNSTRSRLIEFANESLAGPSNGQEPFNT